jgi:hypothetical protein
MSRPIENTLLLLETYIEIFGKSLRRELSNSAIDLINTKMKEYDCAWTQHSETIVDCLNRRFPDYALIIITEKDQRRNVILWKIMIGRK